MCGFPAIGLLNDPNNGGHTPMPDPLYKISWMISFESRENKVGTYICISPMLSVKIFPRKITGSPSLLLAKLDDLSSQ